MLLATIKNSARQLIVFSKLERIVAAICMAIPFLLILTDKQTGITFWPIVIGALVIMAIPLVVSIAAFLINEEIKKVSAGRRSNGIIYFVIAFVVVIAMFVCWYDTLPPNFCIRDSISAYVSMANAQIFGLLLTMAAMLFIFNGAVFANKSQVAIQRNPYGDSFSIVLGILLLGVVLFPCTNDKVKWLHYLSAVGFFGGSAAVTAFAGFHGKKEYKKLRVFISIIMVASFVIWFLSLNVNLGLPVNITSNYITLFWAETVGLWVVGINFIIESLD